MHTLGLFTVSTRNLTAVFYSSLIFGGHMGPIFRSPEEYYTVYRVPAGRLTADGGGGDVGAA